MRRIVPYLLPFALIPLVLSALALSPLAPLTGAQDGQKLSAAATTSSSTKTSASFSDPRLSYPVTKKIEHVDNYHGTIVADPYRWLEEDNSPERAAWVEAQNKVTFSYLEKIPFRGQLAARLEKLFNYPKYSAPVCRGETQPGPLARSI